MSRAFNRSFLILSAGLSGVRSAQRRSCCTVSECSTAGSRTSTRRRVSGPGSFRHPRGLLQQRQTECRCLEKSLCHHHNTMLGPAVVGERDAAGPGRHSDTVAASPSLRHDVTSFYKVRAETYATTRTSLHERAVLAIGSRE